MGIFSLFGSHPAEKVIQRLKKEAEVVNSLEAKYEVYSDDDLRNETYEFKNRLAAGETLDDIAPEAFAVVREAAKRTLGQRHYDVQVIGGHIIHEGKIAEMRTGEGKTLVATMPVYLNALSGEGVHVVTVNDYLARRDAAWIGQIYSLLGLSISVINSGSVSYLYDEKVRRSEVDKEESEIDEERDKEGFFRVAYDYLRPISRQEAYAADITYGTNSEFGFDYLRDNLVYNQEEKRQRGHKFAIIDEIDSILIDEARTPLIISAPHTDSENLYQTLATVVKDFQVDVDYLVDEKRHQIQVLESGVQKAEAALQIENIYADGGIKLVHHLETAVRAKSLYLKDKHYVVQGGEVVIVDESTGRLMPSRRWSGGIHQAVEAKEGLSPKAEARTFASVTYQNYFRMYDKLSGMTGTALTSEEEFFKVYSLEVIPVPTHRPVQRIDQDDLIFQTNTGKFKAISAKIKDLYEKKQPVLVGTVSVENNEELSNYLRQLNIPHQVLNAKNHEAEATIIANAGKPGAITIATNMAGRGVDIKLGGEEATPEEYEYVKKLGGLFVLATERHSSRRIDNQLRGRSGRQGDPGETQFFVSLEDDLMRVFASDRVKAMMGTFGIPEDEPIKAKMISRSLESAQERIEGHNFDARKSVLSYDDVLNTQRQSIYGQRDRILAASEDEVMLMLAEAEITNEVRDFLVAQVENNDVFVDNLRRLFLQVIDGLWVDHLETMDFLRTSVGLKAYGQHDPLVEYRKEGLVQFRLLETTVKSRTDELLTQMVEQAKTYAQEQSRLSQVEREAKVAATQSEANTDSSGVAKQQTVVKNAEDRIGRNDLVKIKKGAEEQVLKYKKAEELFREGWQLVGKAN